MQSGAVNSQTPPQPSHRARPVAVNTEGYRRLPKATEGYRRLITEGYRRHEIDMKLRTDLGLNSKF